MDQYTHYYCNPASAPVLLQQDINTELLFLRDTHQSNRNNLQSAMHHPFQPCRIRIILTESVQPCRFCNTLQDPYHLCRIRLSLQNPFQFCMIGLSLQVQSFVTLQDSFQPYKIRINIDVSVSTPQELHHPGNGDS